MHQGCRAAPVLQCSAALLPGWVCLKSGNQCVLWQPFILACLSDEVSGRNQRHPCLESVDPCCVIPDMLPGAAQPQVRQQGIWWQRLAVQSSLREAPCCLLLTHQAAPCCTCSAKQLHRPSCLQPGLEPGSQASDGVESSSPTSCLGGTMLPPAHASGCALLHMFCSAAPPGVLLAPRP